MLQATHDAIAPLAVAEYVRQSIPGSELVVLSATGHLSHLSAPAEVAAQLRAFLE